MNLFVKNDKGELVAATMKQVLDPKVKLFNEAGEAIDRPDASGDQPAIDLQKVSGIVDALQVKVTGLSEGKSADKLALEAANAKALEAEGKLAAYQKDVARGLILPGSESRGITAGDDGEVWKFIGEKYDLRVQGERLMDKRVHPFHILEDKEIETPDGAKCNPKKEFVKYFSLIGLASQKHPTPTKLKAIELIGKMYGDLHLETKTAIGDAGNAFPIPDIVEAEILAFAREKSVILQYARVWPMVSEKQSFPAESAAATVAWGNDTTAGDPTITEFELDAEELSSYATVKNMTLADSRSDIVSWLGETLSEAAGQELDNKGFNGTGTDDPFICSGILTAACGNSVVFGAGSTAFSNLTATQLSEMIAQLDGLIKQGARFWMNGAILHYVRTLEDTSGRPVFFDGHYGTTTPPQIMAYPYSEVIKAPSTSVANTAFLAFGNMRYFGVGRRLDVSALDVDPYGLWTSNRTRYKLYQRWGLGMALANGFVRLLTAAE